METILLVCFLIGYAAIVFEHSIGINKAASALLAGVICWAIYIVGIQGIAPHTILSQLDHHLGHIANILIFLIGAMTIVEVIDAHNGFRLVTDKIQTKSKRKLGLIIAVVTFLLSAVLDNLTTTIVMISVLSKLTSNRQDKLIFASLVVIAANAGGAWTPIGDVTTTMLWIGDQISTFEVMKKLWIPSIVSLIIPLCALSFLFLKGNVEPPVDSEARKFHQVPKSIRNTMLFIGIGFLLFIPVFKSLTHLPPYMGMLLGLGVMWVHTEMVYRKYSSSFKRHFSVPQALHRIDMASILFFLGILLCIAALQSAGTLAKMAGWLDTAVGDQSIIVIIIGFVSAIVDNVPLVAAAQAMYTYPTDHYFWLFLAYAAGTGGSILIIGSAAGVAAMSLEKIDFIWYLKRISIWVVLGYLAGAVTYISLNSFLIF